MSTPSTLVIVRGDLPSLVLLLMQPNASNVIAWHPEERTDVGRRRKELTQTMAEARGVAAFVVSELAVIETHGLSSVGTLAGLQDTDSVTAQHRESQVLLDAAIVAKQLGCTRIVSPWVVGPDHLRMGHALERAILVVELVEVEREMPQLSIDLPLVERSDGELVELALHLDAPLTSFWPCEHGEAEPCSTCAVCLRWIQAFEQTGVDWPYRLVSSS